MHPLQVYNDTYFQVTLDDLSAEAAPCRLVCHAGSPGILPVQWCLKNGVTLQRPRGYQGHDFDWADYLKQSGTEAAPDTCFPDVSFKNERRQHVHPNSQYRLAPLGAQTLTASCRCKPQLHSPR